jgi:hypothetical protein
MRLLRLCFAVGVLAFLVWGTGCKKSTETTGPTSFTIKGADEVVAALARKDYESAVAALPGVKAELPEDQTAEAWREYKQLLRKLKDDIADAMGGTDEKAKRDAKKAYDILVVMETGR